MARSAHPCIWPRIVIACFFLVSPLSLAFAKNPPFLEMGFFFDYDIPGVSVQVLTTGQCDTIHITWERGAATGPNPTPPYYLQVYTSAFIVPFVIDAGNGLTFDWQVPFIPGTQYQICMFDKNGVTGGCQAIYTVVPSVANNSSCHNVTFPAGAMDVQGTVWNGPMSQSGWVDQCTDLSVIPKNGTPPYTLTIAPTLHPPMNITSNSMDAINWTVVLSWGFPFFISLVDSQGNSWANGPMHSGGNGPTGCLSLDAAIGSAKASVPALVGAVVGSFIGGTLLGVLGLFLFFRFRFGKFASPLHRRVTTSESSNSDGGVVNIGGNGDSNNRHLAETDYHIEPFILPSAANKPTDSTEQLSDATISFPTSSLALSNTTARRSNHRERSLPPAPLSPSETSAPISPRERPQQQVYVVHHDGGRAPVSVIAPDGTEVVELPPRYAGPQTPASLRQQRGIAERPKSGFERS